MDTDILDRALDNCDLGDAYTAKVRQYPHRDMIPHLIKVREVLDPDPRDEIIKKLKTAIRVHHDTWAKANNDNLCLAECRRTCAALAAVDKLERD